MSGLLQRLALRALGRPAAIRTIAGLTAPAARFDSSPHAEPLSDEHLFDLEPDTAAGGEPAAPMNTPPQSIVSPMRQKLSAPG